MASLALSNELISHFKIDDYTHNGPSGQKSVFIVNIEGQKYALKIIQNADERTFREINIHKSYVENKGVPKIHNVEKFGSETIILEEYIEGSDLSALLTEYQGNESKIIELIYNIAIILKPIWEDRYVHRDLKPQNIRIMNDGKPVVLDFGIARALDDETITAAGTQPLTWCFASPEQYLGNKSLISYRTDFFCLGIIAYYLFTGKLPFGDSKGEVEKTFENKVYSLDFSNERNTLTNFCESVLKYYPSERPGRIPTFLNLLKP